MSTTSICYAPMCGHIVIGQARYCPRCGGRMRSPRTVRTLGAVMMACGLTIVAMMGAVTWSLSPALTGSSGALDTARFTGTAEQARMILHLFWMLIAFGVAATAAGAWQVATARRSRLVTVSVLVLAGAAVFAAKATEFSIAA